MEPIWHDRDKDWINDKIAAFGAVVGSIIIFLAIVLFFGWAIVSLIRWML